MNQSTPTDLFLGKLPWP